MKTRGEIRELIFDWNRENQELFVPSEPIEFDDETLRDGLQSPSVHDPSIEEKLEILHLIGDLGIHSANIGLPGAGARAEADALRLAQEIAREGMDIFPNCAARTMVRDVEPIVRISQGAGIAVEAATFIGSSPIRLYTEDWSVDKLLGYTEEAVTFAVKNDLPVMYVTEDTSRAHPDVLEKLYTTAISCGARRICIADTVGHATPTGVRALVKFVQDVIAKIGVPGVKIDWHGHCDRGMAISNALAAIEAGVTRVHGTALSVGERTGNLPLDLLLVNLRLLGWIDNDISKLPLYVQRVSETLRVPIPRNYPVFGEDAFRTATGVHAAAVIKAMHKGDRELADWVYSGVPAGMVGREQAIDIGPMSGASNVVFWLELRGEEVETALVHAILDVAKQSKDTLTDQQIHDVIARFRDRS
ncbi:MAG: 2-isopropylmalate synthase [Gemmatimonadetes bacterium]|nr:2-isopropylmalate synthase [Gemmatimonadota bacterium]